MFPSTVNHFGHLSGLVSCSLQPGSIHETLSSLAYTPALLSTFSKHALKRIIHQPTRVSYCRISGTLIYTQDSKILSSILFFIRLLSPLASKPLVPHLHTLLPSERAPLCESGLASRRLAQDRRATLADDDGLGVREDGGDCEAARAFDILSEEAR